MFDPFSNSWNLKKLGTILDKFEKMGKIMKPGRVVLGLGGRYSGRKAVVVKVIPIFVSVIKQKIMLDML